MIKQCHARALTQDDHFFRYFLPYLLQEMHGFGANVWLPLNRNYKPIGHTSTAFVEYADFVPTHAVKFARDPRTFVGVWDRATEAEDKLWLYNDSPSSRLDYFDRLAILMSRKMPVKNRE